MCVVHVCCACALRMCIVYVCCACVLRMCVYVRAHEHKSDQVCLHMCMHACTCVGAFVHISSSLHKCVCVCVCVHARLCVNMCMCIKNIALHSFFNIFKIPQ